MDPEAIDVPTPDVPVGSVSAEAPERRIDRDERVVLLDTRTTRKPARGFAGESPTTGRPSRSNWIRTTAPRVRMHSRETGRDRRHTSSTGADPPRRSPIPDDDGPHVAGPGGDR